MLDLFEKSFEHIPRVEHGDWMRVLIQDGYVLQPLCFIVVHTSCNRSSGWKDTTVRVMTVDATTG